MCVDMFMSAHVYTHANVYLHTCVYTCQRTSPTCFYAFAYVCVFAHIYVLVYAHVYADVHTHVHTHVAAERMRDELLADAKTSRVGHGSAATRKLL